MNEKDLQVFISTTLGYFKDTAGQTAEMGVPFLKKPDEVVAQDMTGVIGISGTKKGAVYFTAPRAMLADMVKVILGSEEPDTDSLVDMVGEITNTIAGNAREAFGAGFMISIPVVVEGQPKNIRTPANVPVFVIPVKWREHKSYLVIGIQ